jgi:predicted transcriptional regulator of viral defense system
MRWLEVPYYIALLSAAAQHGAAHQAPMRTQVMVPSPRRPIRCGGVAVDFVVRADMSDTPVREWVGPRGYLRYATPEATALELVAYAPRCAGLSHVATVLTELADALEADALAAEGRRCPVAWVQRLGWLLDRVEQPGLAEALLPDVDARASSPTRLLPSHEGTGAPRDPRWRLIVNTDVEPDDL